MNMIPKHIDFKKLDISEEEYMKVLKKQQDEIAKLDRRMSSLTNIDEDDPDVENVIDPENVTNSDNTENALTQPGKSKITEDKLQIVKNKYKKFLCVERMFPDAALPVKGSEQAAGYDIYSYEAVELKPNERKLIRTGIKLLMPPGVYGRIAPRSGMSTKYIDVCAGVIDSDYTGEVKVLLHNHSDKSYFVQLKDRIAQLILEKYLDDVRVKEIKKIEDIRGETQRGSGGFGSTGQ